MSIVRSGEAMEQGLRECCRSIRIGKILIESDNETHEAKCIYARFPDDIAQRMVLLMYPIMSTGNTVVKVNFVTEIFLNFLTDIFSKFYNRQKIQILKNPLFFLNFFSRRWTSLKIMAWQRTT